MFSTLPVTILHVLFLLILSSANTFSLDQPKNLLFCKGLNIEGRQLKWKTLEKSNMLAYHRSTNAYRYKPLAGPYLADLKSVSVNQTWNTLQCDQSGTNMLNYQSMIDQGTLSGVIVVHKTANLIYRLIFIKNI